MSLPGLNSEGSGSRNPDFGGIRGAFRLTVKFIVSKPNRADGQPRTKAVHRRKLLSWHVADIAKTSDFNDFHRPRYLELVHQRNPEVSYRHQSKDFPYPADNKEKA